MLRINLYSKHYSSDQLCITLCDSLGYHLGKYESKVRITDVSELLNYA